jgi:hypothetical protein
MSTTFSKKESTLFENSAICFGVNSLRNAIAEAIRRRMEVLGDLNPSQVAKRSRDKITPAGVRNILKAESGVMVETLVIVAEALGTTAPELLLEALSSKPSPTEDQYRRLLTFYFDHVPPECQLDMLASAQGIYQRRNRDGKIYERAAARTAARTSLATEADQLDSSAQGAETAPNLDPHPLLPGEIVMETPESIVERTNDPNFSLSDAQGTSQQQTDSHDERKRRAS